MRKFYIVPVFLFILGCSFSSASSRQELSGTESRFQGTVKIGMTKEEVKKNWGSPDKIIKKQKNDYDEIWIYIPHWKFKNYLYFKNGILIKGDPNPEDLF